MLAYNFHELVSKLGIFESFAYRPSALGVAPGCRLAHFNRRVQRGLIGEGLLSTSTSIATPNCCLLSCRHDHRLISVTLAYILYRYQAAAARRLSQNGKSTEKPSKRNRRARVAGAPLRHGLGLGLDAGVLGGALKTGVLFAQLS